MKHKTMSKISKSSKINFARKMNIYFYKFTKFIKIFSLLIIILLFSTDIFNRYLLNLQYYFANLGSEILDLKLEKILVEGQINTSKETILRSVNAKIGDPILALDLGLIKQKIEKNDWVKNSFVERKLPNKLHIVLIEREPIARWQYSKQILLIDDEANIIKEPPSSSYNNLILVVGSDAHIYANELIQILKTDLELFKKVEAAIRYGERRWDLKMRDGMIIKMPENSLNKAWLYLIKLHKDKKLFNNEIEMIDLRNNERYYITKKNTI